MTSESDLAAGAGPADVEGGVGGPLRRMLLAVVGLTAAGLVAELAFLEHWEVRVQLTPLVVLGLALALSVAVALRPGPRTVRAFRLVMGVAVAAGIAGVGFHLSDNWAFEREVVPDATFGARLWDAVHGATPLLAPGSLVQLGLVGLIFTWRHPALRPTPSSPSPARAGTPTHSEEHP